MTPDEPSEWTVAVHEAGHACMALELGMSVPSVTIAPSDGNLGTADIAWWTIDGREPHSLRYAVACAGPWAQALLGPISCGCELDYECIDGILNRHFREVGLLNDEEGNLEQINLQLKALDKVSYDRFRKIIPRIFYLARELVKRKTMTGDEVMGILREAILQPLELEAA